MSIEALSKHIVEEYLIREIERSNMPQVRGDDIPETLATLKKYAIPYRNKVVNPNDLQPMQSNVIQSKIDACVKQLKTGKEFNPIFISSDWFIVDGHHRWLANKELGKKEMKVFQIGYPKHAAFKLFNKLDDKLNEGNQISKNMQ